MRHLDHSIAGKRRTDASQTAFAAMMAAIRSFGVASTDPCMSCLCATMLTMGW